MVTPDLEKNICPLTTLKALGFSDDDLTLSIVPEIKLYGTTYKILGVTDLVFYIGYSRKVALFLVIDIQADYDLQFGMSWVEELLDDPSYFSPKGLNPEDTLIRHNMALRQGKEEVLYISFSDGWVFLITSSLVFQKENWFECSYSA